MTSKTESDACSAPLNEVKMVEGIARMMPRLIICSDWKDVTTPLGRMEQDEKRKHLGYIWFREVSTVVVLRFLLIA